MAVVFVRVQYTIGERDEVECSEDVTSQRQYSQGTRIHTGIVVHNAHVAVMAGQFCSGTICA